MGLGFRGIQISALWLGRFTNSCSKLPGSILGCFLKSCDLKLFFGSGAIDTESITNHDQATSLQHASQKHLPEVATLPYIILKQQL